MFGDGIKSPAKQWDAAFKPGCLNSKLGGGGIKSIIQPSLAGTTLIDGYLLPQWQLEGAASSTAKQDHTHTGLIMTSHDGQLRPALIALAAPVIAKHLKSRSAEAAGKENDGDRFS